MPLSLPGHIVRPLTLQSNCPRRTPTAVTGAAATVSISPGATAGWVITITFQLLCSDYNTTLQGSSLNTKAKPKQSFESQESSAERHPQPQEKDLHITYLRDPGHCDSEGNPTSLREHPRRNKLDHFAIIKFPLTTESVMKEDNTTLGFTVDVKVKAPDHTACDDALCH
ncbi:60S ribosomal protein L23a [Galemys pyrenaicus]|uniref:60S ribosomal protein L23a n=1 Tax=Galemys pyrenaicus TaxID=202257 RepID=A0A8J6DHY3_GALPY|nr:60S ribosomal protein L23a [Galemys pyrenaicus]